MKTINHIKRWIGGAAVALTILFSTFTAEKADAALGNYDICYEYAVYCWDLADAYSYNAYLYQLYFYGYGHSLYYAYSAGWEADYYSLQSAFGRTAEAFRNYVVPEAQESDYWFNVYGN